MRQLSQARSSIEQRDDSVTYAASATQVTEHKKTASVWALAVVLVSSSVIGGYSPSITLNTLVFVLLGMLSLSPLASLLVIHRLPSMVGSTVRKRS
jgi:hypothetical protein